MTSSYCGHMRRKLIDDELILGRNIPTRCVRWSLGGTADIAAARIIVASRHATAMRGPMVD